MIKINVQSEEILAKNKMIADAINAIRSRSYSERHPELGKMINCPVCEKRHFSSKKCEPNYSTLVPLYHPDGGYVLPKATFGAAAFARKRVKPHLHPMILDLIQKAKEKFEAAEAKSDGTWQPDMTRFIQAEAQRMRGRANRKAREKQKQQDTSRRINRGLARPGTRP